MILRQVGSDTETVTIICEEDRLNYVLKTCGVTNYSIDDDKLVPVEGAAEDADQQNDDWHILHYNKETNEYKFNTKWQDNYTKQGKQGLIGGTFWHNADGEDTEASFAPFEINGFNYGYYGPSKIITAIRRLENRQKGDNETKYKYTDIDTNFIFERCSPDNISKTCH